MNFLLYIVVRAMVQSFANNVGVLDNEDLLTVILSHAHLLPVSFIAASRVNHTWYTVCQRDERLLLQCAKGRQYLTKRDLMGLFGLTNREADLLPRKSIVGRNGRMAYQYELSLTDGVLDKIGGMEGRRLRLEERAVNEFEVSTAFGRDWRKWWDVKASVTTAF